MKTPKIPDSDLAAFIISVRMCPHTPPTRSLRERVKIFIGWGKNGWKLPGGHVLMGEHPPEGALRESRQETGGMEFHFIHPEPYFHLDEREKRGSRFKLTWLATQTDPEQELGYLMPGSKHELVQLQYHSLALIRRQLWPRVTEPVRHALTHFEESGILESMVNKQPWEPAVPAIPALPPEAYLQAPKKPKPEANTTPLCA